jgi:DnaK suppressor protein
MHAQQVQRYKERLLALRERLREDVRSRVARVPEQIHTPGDISDVPTHTADNDVEGIDSEVAVGGIQIAELNEISAALSRIDDGSFGRCATCGQNIGRTRLDAIPYTAYCVDCKNQREAEEF